MRIGWIGTGIMGYSMAGHLQQNGHELHVFNRTRQASRFRHAGAHARSQKAEWHGGFLKRGFFYDGFMEDVRYELRNASEAEAIH
jgi:ketopantoate reductase